MDNQIQLFTNQLFGSVRALTINGEPWFVGRDVATMLGYTEASKAVREHVFEEDKGVSKIDTPGGMQDVVIINESGLYCLILSSKLPSARQFKYWVTSDVLPTMRKIGFSRSMQILQEENMKLKQQQAALEQTAMFSGVDRLEVAEMRNQIIDKLHTIPIGTPVTPEMKQFLIHYDPDWEG